MLRELKPAAPGLLGDEEGPAHEQLVAEEAHVVDTAIENEHRSLDGGGGPPPVEHQDGLAARYTQVRSLTDALAEPLSAEDQTVQSMPDTSPTKWHRAHTTWFFETFVLRPNLAGYRPLDERYNFLFNSYYVAAGPRYPRVSRGLITRPGVEEVGDYRAHVDRAMAQLLDGPVADDVAELVTLGLNHEQQHQELLVMDIKHVLSHNPLDPVYRWAGTGGSAASAAAAGDLGWTSHPGGLVEVGHADDAGFAYDNESPRHTAYLHPFAVADVAVTNGDWLAFMADGGYRRPELWLSDGWATAQAADWEAPLYWRDEDRGAWSAYTLAGRLDIDPAQPVCHVSYYEADAFARWADARLPTEFEWETVAAAQPASALAQARVLDLDVLHPLPAPAGSGPRQLFGDVWEWTSSAYLPYPGFRAAEGAIGEYNGKFMVNQHVLRGGCCATPAGHVRGSYRNFFPPSSRWPFAGVRLARDL